jgi:ABC-type nitrate/sulfonate/bicarbonate transport system ATPase subunit
VLPSSSLRPCRLDRRATGLDAITVNGIRRSFQLGDRRLLVLDGVDMHVTEREIVAIVGPNGSGKSTLLRVMSGLLAPDDGTVLTFGSPVTGVDSRLGLVFQEPRLLPWRDVLANVAFPLELAGVDQPEREARAREMLALAGVEEFTEALPAQLSGGMAQRASLARALVTGPSVLLLDEPFSALDALTRERLDGELLGLWARTGTTIVLVTHSIPEAVYLADRVLVMSPRPGRIVSEIVVGAAGPRARSRTDVAGFSAAAEKIREALATSGADDGPAASG